MSILGYAPEILSDLTGHRLAVDSVHIMYNHVQSCINQTSNAMYRLGFTQAKVLNNTR